MKIGLFTDSLTTSFSEALDWVVEHGIEAVEIGTGNFSPAAHCNLDELLQSEEARTAFRSEIESRGLVLSALNCNGNLLDPHPARGQASQDALAALPGMTTTPIFEGTEQLSILNHEEVQAYFLGRQDAKTTLDNIASRLADLIGQ